MGQIFSRKCLNKYYKDKYGNKNYWIEKWAGSNLPDWVFKPFIDGKFGKLNKMEQRIVDEVKDKVRPFYVIMTCESNIYARDHEIAHALYYTEPKYSKTAHALVSGYYNRLSQPIQKLKDIGYAGDVLIDELHVYCGIYHHHYLGRLGINVPEDLKRDLIDLFRYYKIKILNEDCVP